MVTKGMNYFLLIPIKPCRLESNRRLWELLKASMSSFKRPFFGTMHYNRKVYLIPPLFRLSKLPIWLTYYWSLKYTCPKTNIRQLLSKIQK